MTDNSAREKRKPRKATKKSLENAALFYLERYASSAENLRRVLLRRVERSARAHDTDRDEGAELVDGIIHRYKDANLLDDAVYASMRVSTLRRRGSSARAIRATLMSKGVAAEEINQALEAHAEQSPMAELTAACAYARRRRLGPWRQKDREERHDRDLAALARQGYSFDIVRRVIDATDIATLEDDLENASEA